jgi:hypothetical protein
MQNSIMNALIGLSVRQAGIARERPARWTAEDDHFLRDNLGKLEEAEIARKLGRSVIGVHLRWKRDLQLPAPSKAPGVLTANEVARRLGLDGHTIGWFVDKGFLPGRMMPGQRKIRLIKQEDLEKWVTTSSHWPYFDVDRVRDAALQQKIREAMTAWGDEWWTTKQVAKLHGVTVKDVLRYIKHGKIRAIQIEHSRGGRYENRAWRPWYVLKSEATRDDLHFVVRGPRGKYRKDAKGSKKSKARRVA